MKIIFVLLFLMVLILPIELHAQITEPNKIQKTNKTLVSVPVSVSDREGHYISGLKKEDFTLYEDGVEQKITVFATYDEPLNIALLLDTSISTLGTLEKIKDAAKNFIELLNPNDQCLIATFDSQVNILNSFTSNQQTLKNSLDKVQTATQEGTVIYRAVEQIAQKSFNNAQGRKVIVLLSDGKDFGSSVTKDELFNQLEESDVLIYTVFYKTGADLNKLIIGSDGTVSDGTVKERMESKKPQEKKPQKKKKEYSIFIPAQAGLPSEEEIKLLERNADIKAVDFLKGMADTTAGRFYPSDTPKLSEIFKKVASELRQQYRLGYQSKDAANDTAVHNISVKVERSDVVVRARGKFRAKQL
ncbi:MAG: VWA domain-containing protein [Acidobacteriota bacterium]|nr:VWA domain-containing protein [Acidobacteriota bacterium]